MTEINGELIYEILKSVQGRLDKMDSSIWEIRLTQMGMQNDIHNIYGMLARSDDRLDRIERRLELR